MREHSGHTLKSSLRHVLTCDRRDNAIFPSVGSLLRMSQVCSRDEGVAMRDRCDNFSDFTFVFRPLTQYEEDSVVLFRFQSDFI